MNVSFMQARSQGGASPPLNLALPPLAKFGQILFMVVALITCIFLQGSYFEQTGLLYRFFQKFKLD